MRKRILNLVFVFALALSLCACGSNTKNEKETSTKETSSTSNVVDNTEDSSEDTTKEPETTTEHKHEYVGETTKASTCTEKGVKTFTCACGETYTEEMAAIGHSFVNYKYNNDATVDKDGTKTSKCSNCDVTDTKTAENTKISYTYKEMKATMYTTAAVNVRAYPNGDSNKVGSLAKGVAVTVTGQCNETKWYRVEYDGNTAYVSNNYLTTTKPADPLPAKYKGIEEAGPYKVVNGIAFNLDTEEVYGEYADRNNAFYTKLCEAGYNKPIYWDEVGAWFMLFENPYEENTREFDNENAKWWEYLENYVKDMGYTVPSSTVSLLNSYGDHYARVDVE